MSERPPVRHIQDLIASRRGVLAGLAGLPLLSLPAACATADAPAPGVNLGFVSVAATHADQVTVPAGYQVRTLIAWGDALFDSVSTAFDPSALTRAEQEQRFGQNNDMLALFPAEWSFSLAQNQDRMILCANNEYFSLDLMFPNIAGPRDFTPAHFEAALASTGISVVTLERADGHWRAKRDASPSAGFNRRITPFTPIVLSGPAAAHPWIEAAGAFVNARVPAPDTAPNPDGAIRCGTSANCAGGQTPWGTYLSSEENFNNLFARDDENAAPLQAAMREGAYILDRANFGYPGEAPKRLIPAQFDLSQNPHGPSLYGWTVEVDPYDPSWAPRKRTALGRRKGECATTALTRDGRVAVYSGDDQINEFVYKFVSAQRFNPADRLANRDLLDKGQLYVARFNEDGSGEWLALTADAANAAAREAEYPHLFRDAGDLAVRAREAARLMGATPMDRPEDVEALKDANWIGLGPVLIACTNNREQSFDHPGNPRRESPRPNRAQANLAGHILRLNEAGEDCGATRFSWDIFALAGDPDSTDLVVNNRAGLPTHISTKIDGASTFTGDRFACPDNFYIDSLHNVWISTDGSDAVFADCNDAVLVTPANGERVVKRFLVGPPGSEICGPTMAPDERAFFCAVQHPGDADAAGVSFSDTRWTGAAPPSHFPDGSQSWPRSAVVVVTREDGGVVGT